MQNSQVAIADGGMCVLARDPEALAIERIMASTRAKFVEMAVPEQWRYFFLLLNSRLLKNRAIVVPEVPTSPEGGGVTAFWSEIPGHLDPAILDAVGQLSGRDDCLLAAAIVDRAVKAILDERQTQIMRGYGLSLDAPIVPLLTVERGASNVVRISTHYRRRSVLPKVAA